MPPWQSFLGGKPYSSGILRASSLVLSHFSVFSSAHLTPTLAHQAHLPRLPASRLRASTTLQPTAPSLVTFRLNIPYSLEFRVPDPLFPRTSPYGLHTPFPAADNPVALLQVVGYLIQSLQGLFSGSSIGFQSKYSCRWSCGEALRKAPESTVCYANGTPPSRYSGVFSCSGLSCGPELLQ